MNRALRVGWPALTIVVALAASIGATAGVSGGASPLLVARAAALVLLGLGVAAVLGAVMAAVLEGDVAARGRLLDVAAGAAATWTVLAAATALLLYLEQAPDPGSPSFGPGLVTFVFDVEIGRAWLIAAALAAVLTALLIAVRSRRGAVGLGIAAVVAAVPVALQSAMSGDPLDVERGVVSAGLVQLVALGAWAGVLALRSARLLPVLTFAAVVIAVGASASALLADGAVTGPGAAGAVAIVLAGLVAIAAAVARRDLRGPQLLLLGAGLGLAAAGSTTRTTPDVPARTSPAEILTGSPLPQGPSLGALLAFWRPDAAWLVLAVVLLAGYLLAVRRAGAGWSPLRTVSWVVGVLLLGWLTNGGPAAYAPLLVVASLARLVALLLVVPLLLAGGAPLRLAARVAPALRLGGAGGPLGRPVPVVVLTLLAAALLVGTGLLRWSVTDPVGTEAVLVVALLLGLLLVRAVGASGGRRGGAVVAAALLLVAALGAGLLLASSSGLLAADWFGAMGWGTDALAAQRGAAALVLPLAVVPAAVLLVVALRAPRSATLSRSRTAAA